MQYKRVTYFLFAFLALSCAKEQEAHVVPVVTEGIPLVAQVPQPLETKSAITDDTGIFTWTAGDELAVYAAHPSFGARYYTATLPPAEVGKTSSEFTVDYAGERTHYAVYPAQFADDAYYSPSDLRLTLPGNYKMSTSTPVHLPPMVAVNEEGNALQFNYVSGLLRLTLNGVPNGTDRIEFWTGKKIVGSYAVDLSDAAHPFISLTNPVAAGNDTRLTFTMSPEVTTATQNGIVLNIPLPAGTYYNLGLTFFYDLTTTSASQYRLYLSEKRVIEAGHGYQETIDCSKAKLQNFRSFSVPDTQVNWGASKDITHGTDAANYKLLISQGGSWGNTSNFNWTGVNADLELTCFTDDPSIATAYVFPQTDNAKPVIRITGTNPGETYLTVRARFGDQYYYAEPAKITVTNVGLTKPVVTYPKYMVVGDRAVLKASVSGTFESISYQWTLVSGFDKVSLTSDGILTANAVGTAEITCTVITNEGTATRYPFKVKVVNNPPGTLKGVFTCNVNGDAVFFADGNLIYYKDYLGDNVYEDYDKTYDPDNMNGHFEFFHPQYDVYTGRYHQGIVSKNYVPAFDMFNYRLPMNHFSSAESTRPVEVEGVETTGWHAPSQTQWMYIIKNRPASSLSGVSNARYVYATVSPVSSVATTNTNFTIQVLLIFPDNYTHPAGLPSPQKINENSGFGYNVYSPDQIAQLTEAGVVVLPRRERLKKEDDIPTFNQSDYSRYLDCIADKNDVGVVSYMIFNGGSAPYWEGYNKSGDYGKGLYNLRLVKDCE